MAKNKSIIIDFDGTIVDHTFPKIGKPKPQAFDVMRDLQKEGYDLILWTCRENEPNNINKQYLKEAVEFCKKHGIEFKAVNETIEENEFRPKNVNKRKPYATYYIDDRNLGGFPGWGVVREVILEGKNLKWEVE